eukprot:scaffold272960_cov27-Prasinocladus_malaysianus.AAC.1
MRSLSKAAYNMTWHCRLIIGRHNYQPCFVFCAVSGKAHRLSTARLAILVAYVLRLACLAL